MERPFDLLHTKIIYRLATEADLPTLAALRWAFRTEDEPAPDDVDKVNFLAVCLDFLRQGLETSQWVYWVAEANGEIVSHVFVQRARKVPKPSHLYDVYGYVTNVYTQPAFRARGIGSELMQHVVQWAEAEKLDTLIVWPSEKNGRFYQRLGFRADNDVMELEFVYE